MEEFFHDFFKNFFYGKFSSYFPNRIYVSKPSALRLTMRCATSAMIVSRSLLSFKFVLRDLLSGDILLAMVKSTDRLCI